MDREFETTSPLQLTYVVRKFSIISASHKHTYSYISLVRKTDVIINGLVYPVVSERINQLHEA
jgi:hypothetical protein